VGSVCISTATPVRCGCVNSLDCSVLGATNGNVCLNGYCSCASASDCAAGHCCNTQASPAGCVASGTTVSGLGTCNNGTWQ
jgi:hypothetical protein